MFQQANTAAMAGAAPCKHCRGTLHRLLFDATGRVDAPRYYRDSSGNRRSSGNRSVPIFPGFSLADAQAGVTPPGAVVCPTCDAPDETLTLDRLAQHLRLIWDVETFTPPEQPESD